ncbi:MAG: ribosome recycling factor [Patescibacteria group bacterium]|nr:ribosome recycling factor [Patescibacteria group bacterium]MDE2437890.1 ribosome recycling factor [Patescibacteria group bacterium]
MDYIKQFESTLQHIVDNFSLEIRALKAGQASPALIEDIDVPCYGDQVMKLKQIAAISVSSSREMVIQPWDAALIQPIAKAVSDIPGGVQITPDKNLVRIVLPVLTEERRREFIKLVNKMAEESRIKMRHARDDMNKKVETIAAEDERFRTKDGIDDATKRFQKDIDLAAANKEKELLAF